MREYVFVHASPLEYLHVSRVIRFQCAKPPTNIYTAPSSGHWLKAPQNKTKQNERKGKERQAGNCFQIQLGMGGERKFADIVLGKAGEGLLLESGVNSAEDCAGSPVTKCCFTEPGGDERQGLEAFIWRVGHWGSHEAGGSCQCTIRLQSEVNFIGVSTCVGPGVLCQPHQANSKNLFSSVSFIYHTKALLLGHRLTSTGMLW